MLNKNHSLTLIFVSLLFFITTGEIFADVSAELEQAKTSILSHIQNNNFTGAKVQTRELVVDFAGHPDLPEALHWIVARECERRLDLKEDANSIHQQIMQNYTGSPYTGKVGLRISNAEIISLILLNSHNQAKEALDELAANFAGHPDLPEALYWTARECERRLKLEDANDIYQQIIRDYPDSSQPSKAKLGASRAKAMSLIQLNNYSQSKEALDKLIADFSDHPDLPETLYWFAERYRWAREYGEAKGIYKQIMQNHPGSFWASRAKIGISRADALSLINSGSSEQLVETVDKLIGDFKDHPDLPETLYWIAQECEWMIKLKEANSIYQQVINCCPGGFWVDKARLGISRVNVGDVIEKEGITAAKPAFDEMIADFNDHPDLPWALYWIAKRYEGRDEFEKAEQLYSQIIEQYPDSEYSELAQIDIPALNIFSLMRSGECVKAMEALDKLLADFNNNPNLPQAVLMMGEKYYKEGLLKEKEGLADQANNRFEKAVKIWDRLINKFSDSLLTPEIYCWAGDGYLKLCRYEESIQCFQKVADNYPGYEHAGHALFMIGRTYETLGKAGIISVSEAKLKAKATYEQLLGKYPACPAAKFAQHWLSHH